MQHRVQDIDPDGNPTKDKTHQFCRLDMLAEDHESNGELKSGSDILEETHGGKF